MKRKCLLSSLILGLLFSVAACSKEEIAFEECNDIFTEGFYEEIQEIVYWRGEEYVVDDETACREIFALFSSLSLTEIPDSEYPKGLLGGYQSIDFVTKDGLERITLRTEYMSFNSKDYRIDKNILDELREIVFGEE